jgi:hypothetical protein
MLAGFPEGVICPGHLGVAGRGPEEACTLYGGGGLGWLSCTHYKRRGGSESTTGQVGQASGPGQLAGWRSEKVQDRGVQGNSVQRFGAGEGFHGPHGLDLPFPQPLSKGVHLTLSSWLPDRDEGGWNIKRKAPKGTLHNEMRPRGPPMRAPVCVRPFSHVL